MTLKKIISNSSISEIVEKKEFDVHKIADYILSNHDIRIAVYGDLLRVVYDDRMIGSMTAENLMYNGIKVLNLIEIEDDVRFHLKLDDVRLKLPSFYSKYVVKLLREDKLKNLFDDK